MESASVMAAMAQNWHVVIDVLSGGAGNLAPLFGSAVSAFEAWSSGPGFAFLGDNPRGANAADFDDLIAQRFDEWSGENPLPISASDNPHAPSMLAILEPATLYGRALDRIRISPYAADGARPIGTLRALLWDLGSIPGLVNVSAQHELLSAHFYARTAAERAFASTPEELRAYLPPIVAPDWNLPDPGLALPDLVDPRSMPEAVWSANLFGPAQVACVGHEALLTADWTHVEVTPSGALLSLASTEPPQSMTEDAASRIVSIISQLGLAALQHSTVPGEGRKP